jgi:hypothetical protein
MAFFMSFCRICGCPTSIASWMIAIISIGVVVLEPLPGELVADLVEFQREPDVRAEGRLGGVGPAELVGLDHLEARGAAVAEDAVLDGRHERGQACPSLSSLYESSSTG